MAQTDNEPLTDQLMVHNRVDWPASNNQSPQIAGSGRSGSSQDVASRLPLLSSRDDSSIIAANSEIGPSASSLSMARDSLEVRRSPHRRRWHGMNNLAVDLLATRAQSASPVGGHSRRLERIDAVSHCSLKDLVDWAFVFSNNFYATAMLTLGYDRATTSPKVW